MKLTKERLKDFSPCQDGLEWFIEQRTEDVFELLDRAIKSKNDDVLSYALWGIAQLLDKENKIRYAVYSAKQVLSVFEEKYPDDKRPRKAIEAAEKYLKNQTKENRSDVACATCDAARAAACAAADDAADAACAACAASDVVDVIDADDAACAAANTATYNDTRIEIQTKIIIYGSKLLKQQKGKIK